MDTGGILVKLLEGFPLNFWRTPGGIPAELLEKIR